MSTVLFVTHDADLRAVAWRVLVNAGYQVTPVAHAGHALLACLEREPFDVVVLEDQMDGSGAAVAERLRRYCPDVQVVRMCDARPSSADEVILLRPFIADDLIGAVAEATRGYTRRGATTR